MGVYVKDPLFERKWKFKLAGETFQKDQYSSRNNCVLVFDFIKYFIKSQRKPNTETV